MFKWEDFISVSEDLLKNSKENEAYFRTIINRAYYGAFCTARDKASFEKDKSKSIHQIVKNFYLHSEDQEKKLVGKMLAQLLKFRKAADYELNCWDCTKNKATFAVLMAQDIIEELK